MALTGKDYDDLLFSIFNLLLKKGLKGLTMDSVAESLSISKRTLYEIFVSKTDMVVKTMTYINEKRREVSNHIFEHAPNVLVGLVQIFLIQRDFMCKVNVNFFYDMDRLFPDVKLCYAKESKIDYIRSLDLFETGVKQGVLRGDADYKTLIQVFGIQMESLKRMENSFPPEITLVKGFDVIYMMFLRSIVSPKGMAILDDVANNFLLYKEQIKKYTYYNEDVN